jgi:hypothetical protein
MGIISILPGTAEGQEGILQHTRQRGITRIGLVRSLKPHSEPLKRHRGIGTASNVPGVGHDHQRTARRAPAAQRMITSRVKPLPARSQSIIVRHDPKPSRGVATP